MVNVVDEKSKVAVRCGTCLHWVENSNFCEVLDSYYRKAGECEAWYPRGKY